MTNPTTTPGDAREALAELEQRVLDGDTRVTAEQLANAAAAVRHEDLLGEAARRAGVRSAAEQLELDREAFRSGTLAALAAQLETLREQYTSTVTVFREIQWTMGAYLAARAAALGAAGRVGLVNEVAALPGFDRGAIFDRAIDEACGKVLTRGSSRVNGPPPTLVRHPLHSDAHAAAVNAGLAARHAAEGERIREKNRLAAEEREAAARHRERIEQRAANER